MKKTRRRNPLQVQLSRQWHLRTIDVLHLGYLGLTGLMIIVFHKNQTHWGLYLAIRLVLAGGIVLLNCLVGRAEQPKLFWRFLRDWYTPGLFIYYYEETELLNQLIIPLYFDFVVQHWHSIFAGRMEWLHNGLMYLDPFLEHWDEVILGFQPSLQFHNWIPFAFFSELMHFGYFSYYLLIPILGFALWFKHRHKEFDTFIVKLAINMLWCYTFFIIFPTSGPKSYFPGAHDRIFFGGYVFKSAMDIILRYGGISNGAFPSSHVAMATVILLCARKYERTIFWIMLPLVTLLCFSTVYIREHYFVDVPAGIAVGSFFFYIGDWIKQKLDNWLGNPGSPSPSPSV
ncbi:phosphatase PAP2 family protein [Candidatus Sumerlaeota bacterium]|nr:phosphatase PAP2 family protein [Candidatus Sumerlaeota bacterium]